MSRVQLTDAEISAYRHHPETFFGEYRRVTKNTNDPLSLFEFFHDSYKNTPRERLIELMKSAPDVDELTKLPNDELLLVFCDRNVGAAYAQAERRKQKPPATE